MSETTFLERGAELAPDQAVGMYQFVDDIDLVAVARDHERLRAEALLESRRNSGSIERAGQIPVDALSTARNVIVMEQSYGTDSEEHQQSMKGLVLDCQRLVGEWYRKKKPEYFAPIRHVFNPDTEEFFSHGLSIRQMTDNALMPIDNNPEDEARRVNERVEEATPHLLRSLGCIAIGQESIRTISECTDKAIDDYAYDMKHGDKHRGYSGYVPEIQKVMIRDIRLDDKTNDRFEEQIGLPGTYITHEIIQMALEEQGLQAQHLGKTELHGSQILARDSLLDFAALLDAVGSREYCLEREGKTLFMGEVVSITHQKNYDTFHEEALQRQEDLKDLALTTAHFVLDLARDGFSREKAPAHVEEFVKKQLLDLAKQDEVVAEQMFDKETAVGLQQVAALERQGKYDEALQLMQTVEEQAPGGGFCGAGSCGLESVDTRSESGKDLMKKLGADDKDSIVKDTERACRCGKKSIVYAYNKNKVNKLCTSCGAFESKVSKA